MMVVIRNRLSETVSGGPRQFSEIRDKFLILLSDEERAGEVRSELDRLEMNVKEVRSAPVLIAEPLQTIDEVLRKINAEAKDVSDAAEQVRDAREGEDNIVDATASTIRATSHLLNEISGFGGVGLAEFGRTFVDFGPENLRLSVDDMLTLQSPEEENNTLQDTLRALEIPAAWEETRGENSIVVIFDTAFSEGLIDSGRIVGEFHGEGVDSVYDSSEGHGTMTVGAAAANSDEGVPFDGVAPDADVALVRITGADGQIRNDLIAQGWDWLVNADFNSPVVTNHSYGNPLCVTPRQQFFCNNALASVIRIANSDSDILSVYAAGNSAMTCGHRPAGFTSSITGHNSMASVIAAGALLTNGQEVQRYSSHGRGDCAPRADPKPNACLRIPQKTYYGTATGWTVKDMSSGPYGSSGGTSHAAPMLAGALALVQSSAQSDSIMDILSNDSNGPLQTEEMKEVISNNSTLPRRTIPNTLGVITTPRGFDARYGWGEFKVKEAIGGS